MTYDDLHAMRDNLVREARINGESPATVDRYLSEFVHQIEDEMARTGTVFYQP